MAPLGAQPRTADSAVQQTYTATRDSWSMVDSTAPNTSFHNVAQDAEIGTGNGGSNRRRAHCGRRADALVAYRQVHRVLDDELGVEPGHDLRSVYEKLLTS